MTIKKGKINLYEFPSKDAEEGGLYQTYFEYIRDYENVSMIGRPEYLLSMNKETIERYVTELNNSPNDSFFAVDYDGRFVGTLKIGHIDWRIGTADLGIMIGSKECRGKGLSIKICEMGVEYAFKILGLRRISAGCYERNIAMNKCFEKLGFHRIGVERKNVIFGSEYENHVLYDLLREEWEVKHE